MTGVMIYLPGNAETGTVHVFVADTTAEQFLTRYARGEFHNLRLERPEVRIVEGMNLSGTFAPGAEIKAAGAEIPHRAPLVTTEGNPNAGVSETQANATNLQAGDTSGDTMGGPTPGGANDGTATGGELAQPGGEDVRATDAAPTGDATGKPDGSVASGSAGKGRGSKKGS